MGERYEELLYVTGMKLVNDTKVNKKNKQNTEGSEMRRRRGLDEVITVETSELHKAGIERKYGILEYIENDVIYAKGEGVLSTVESFLTGYLGYNLTDVGNDYEWADYPRNKNYEVCELGLVRNKRNGRILNMSLKGRYERGVKWVWRTKVTIPPVGTQTVAQVVAETFIGEKPEVRDAEGNPVLVVVGHKNDMPIDNRAENLEYITADRNKTIDWVLRDVNDKQLNVWLVNGVYKQILEVLEDKYGEDFEVKVLTDEDENEVAETIDVYKRTVREVYRFVKFGKGLLADCVVEDGNFYMV